ncbi:MAG: hypothetical protein AAGK78_03115 [Planctomycetota bacterium]
MNTTEHSSPSSPRKGRGIDAEALLASLAPVVAKPEENSPRASLTAAKSAEPTKTAAKKKSAEPASGKSAARSAANSADSRTVLKQITQPAEPAREDEETDDDVENITRDIAPAKPARKAKAKAKAKAKPSAAAGNAGQRQRAKLDVEINPGEGTTAIYVRVPRTTHLALKIQALENQAAMEGPTELASLVRTAIGEYLERQAKKKAA